MEGIDLSFVSTEDLLKELKIRERDSIKQAVENINNSIQLINDFGIEIAHKSENIRLLPNFEIKTYADKNISGVFYKDEEY